MEDTIFTPFTELTDQTWENLNTIDNISEEEILINKIKQIRAKHCLSFNEALEIVKIVETKSVLENMSYEISRISDNISDLMHCL